MRRAVIDTDSFGDTGIVIYSRLFWIWWPVGVLLISKGKHMEKEVRDELMQLRINYGSKITIIDKRKKL